MIYVRATIRHR